MLFFLRVMTNAGSIRTQRARKTIGRRRGIASLVAVAAGLFCARVANAQPTAELTERTAADRPPLDRPSSARDKPLSVGVAARTDVPLFIGAQSYVEHGPTRLRFTGAIGMLPGTYARLVNGALENAGAYDARLGRALGDTLTSGFAWNAHVGFRPFARTGLLLEAGYGTATLVANGDARSLVGRETGTAIPAVNGVDTNFAFRSTLHLVDARVGWEWLLADRVTVAASLGISRAVGASTSIDQPYFSRAPNLAQNAIAQGLAQLDDSLTRYGWVPTAGASAGYRF